MQDSHARLADPGSPTPATAAAVPDQQASRSALFIVFLVVFIDLLGFGIVLPLLPRYGSEFLEPLLPGAERAVLRGALLGVLMSAFSAMQFIFAPLWGRVSDRIGRRPVLLVGLLGSVASYALFGVASMLNDDAWRGLGLALLYLTRIGQGIAGATIATAQAVIADSTSPEKRSRGMALIGAAFGIGFTFGPLLGLAALWIAPHPATAAGAGLDWARAAPGLLAAGLSLLALALGWWLLPETWRPGAQTPQRGWLNLHRLGTALRTPTVGALVVTFFLATFAFANLEATLAVLTRDVLQFDDRQNFLVFAYVGFMLMVAQGYVYQRLARSGVQEPTFMVAGVALMGLGLAALAGVAARSDVAPDEGLPQVGLYVGLAVAVFGFAFLTPSVQSLISRRSDPARQGEILGVNQSAAAMARILGPLLGLSLYRVPPAHVLPYAVGTGLLAIVLLLTLRISRG
jgi:MFS family permease